MMGLEDLYVTHLPCALLRRLLLDSNVHTRYTAIYVNIHFHVCLATYLYDRPDNPVFDVTKVFDPRDRWTAQEALGWPLAQECGL